MGFVRVVATRLGYYKDKRRREGIEFTIPEKDFSSNWMEVIEKKAKPPKDEMLDEVMPEPKKESSGSVI